MENETHSQVLLLLHLAVVMLFFKVKISFNLFTALRGLLMDSLLCISTTAWKLRKKVAASRTK